MKPEQVPAHEASVLHRLQVRLVGAACRFPRAILVAALILSALSIYAACRRLEYRTQRSDLINPHKDYQQRWRKYLAEFGDDDDIVVVVKGSDRQRMQQALDALAARVQEQPEHFDRLFFKVDLRHLHNRALLFLSKDQIDEIRNNLKSMSMLLDWGPLGWRSLTLYQLLHEADARARKLSPGQPLCAADDQFLTQLCSISKSATAMLDRPADYRNPWNSLLANPPEQNDLLAEPQYFFSGDGTLAFLLTRPIKEQGSFTGAQPSVDAMRAIIAQTRPGFADLDFGLTGLPVLETDEMVAAQSDTHLASWLAIAGVTVLFFIVYRSFYYPLLTVGTLLIGTSLAMGWMTLTVGHLNILSATFAVMLIGMGDYGVLWVMRYEHERRHGAGVDTALRRTAIFVGAGTLTAALTTALAFCAAMLADFQAVAELGWIAGSGVLLCALSCFTILPALLKLCDRRPSLALRPEMNSLQGVARHWFRRLFVPSLSPLPAPVQCPPGAETWLPWLTGKQSRWVIGGSLVLTAALAVCATRVTYDHNLLHLQVRNLDSVKWELTLIEHTAGASWHALSYTGSPEAALALKARYERLPEVSRVVEVASLVPRDEDQKLALLGDIQHRLRWLPERGAVIAYDLPDVGGLKQEISALSAALQPMAAAGTSTLLHELVENLGALHGRLNEHCGECLRDFEQRMAADLAGDLHRLRDVATPAPIALAELPSALRERYIGKSGKWLLQVFGKDCLWDFEPLAHFAQQIQTVDPEATGKPFATVEGLRAMKNGFQWAGVYAFCAIVLVLLWDFRHLGRTLVALAPLGMGMILALGIMGLVGLPLNPANMIALPLVLGVGVDNGVHVLHDYLAHKKEGRARLSRAIGRGVLVKALTTMIGFGTLMVSSQRGLAGLGFCLALGVGCCMVTALVFLPAVLNLLSARLRCQTHHPSCPAELQQAA
jgi:hopanoid biosynthesis associated RND transporter like protein HpnN